MIEYIKGVISAAAVSSIVLSALPGENRSNGKYVKFICALTLLLVILSPISGISKVISATKNSLKAFTEFHEADTSTSSERSIIDAASDEISKYIKDILAEKYNFDRSNIKVKIIINDDDPENVIIEEIQVFASERSAQARRKAEIYLSDKLLTEVRIFGS